MVVDGLVCRREIYLTAVRSSMLGEQLGLGL